jgi:hypothetical protein
MHASYFRKRRHEEGHRRLEPARHGLSLLETGRIVGIALALVATHVAASVGLYLWVIGSSKRLYDVSMWIRVDVTLENHTFATTCERCCLDGRLTTFRHPRIGSSAWKRDVRYTVHSLPKHSVEDVGHDCDEPRLPITCEPMPCNLTAWCETPACEGELLWREPQQEGAAVRKQAASHRFIGPLLLIPASLLDIYLLLLWLRNRYCLRAVSFGHDEVVSPMSMRLEGCPTHPGSCVAMCPGHFGVSR